MRTGLAGFRLRFVLPPLWRTGMSKELYNQSIKCPICLRLYDFDIAGKAIQTCHCRIPAKQKKETEPVNLTTKIVIRRGKSTTDAIWNLLCDVAHRVQHGALTTKQSEAILQILNRLEGHHEGSGI